MRLLVVIVVAGFVAAFSVSVALAHDRAYCEGDGEFDHYLEDVNDGPPGRYLLYVHTSHEDLFIKRGSGVSSLSYTVIEGPNTIEDQNVIEALGITISVADGDTYYGITYRTTRVGAVVLICFSGNLGFFHPIPLDGSQQQQPPPPPPPPPPSDNAPTPRPTREATPTPTPTPTATPTPTPTPRPTATSTPRPTRQATPRPTREATPTPTPTPSPTPEPTPAPTPEPTPTPTADAYSRRTNPHAHSSADAHTDAGTDADAYPRTDAHADA